MKRARNLTCTHEAAHLVAHHYAGTLGTVDLVQVPRSGDAGGGAAGRVGTTRTFEEVARNRGDAESAIMVCLAGTAALRELAVDAEGGDEDERTAGTIALAATNWNAEEAAKMFDECKARAEQLVAEDDFQALLLRLSMHLMEVPAISGRLVEKLLWRWEVELQSSKSRERKRRQAPIRQAPGRRVPRGVVETRVVETPLRLR